MRLTLLIFAFTLAFLTPLFIFQDTFDVALSGDAAVARLSEYGHLAWAVGMGLIVADLVLPIPATAVMAALGYLYGTVAGGLLGGAASLAAGLIAYGATRLIGHKAAVFLAGQRDLQRTEAFFRQRGGLAVAMTRPMPLLPEVIACLAGLSRMPFRLFFVSLCCGSFPTGFAFAAIGSMGVEKPSLAIAAGCVIPVILWSFVHRAFRMPPATSPSHGDAPN
ncbi:MAG: VTT domain-containing protein [Phycisphaerae bacterium]|nr:VTT domain-containing protein [Phycisphaerae bacterium]